MRKIEKIWIIFQFFYGIYQLHEGGIYHGDLRIENILLTSNSSVFISDISPFKPAYIKIDDIGMYTFFLEIIQLTTLEVVILLLKELLKKEILINIMNMN